MLPLTIEELDASDFESITVSSVAIGFTGAKIDPGSAAPAPRMVLITVETNPIRYRYDGSDPTAAIGHSAAAGDVIRIFGRVNLKKFKAIATGSDATLRVTYHI